MVFVIGKHGNVLMPCSDARSRHLLEDNQAKVIRRDPFTIQMIVETTNNIQKTTLGIDPGYAHIGFSVVTDKKELISGTLNQESVGKNNNPTKERLDNKSMWRRTRRSRLWRRKERFSNRASSRKKDRIPPSINRKYITHINLVNKLSKYVPIGNIIIEKNKFDIAKLDNPEIVGVEYQQGKLYNTNRVNYLYSLQGGICPICGKKLDGRTNIHHIMPRSEGGSDNIDNLVLLHEDCHQNIDHEQWQVYEKIFDKKGIKSKHKQDTFMNIIRHKLIDKLNAEITYGYITSCKRKELCLEKEHYNDAFVIAGGDSQIRSNPYIIKQLRRNDRSLQTNNHNCKGGRLVRKANYEYKKGDLIYVDDGKWYVCGGMHGKGRYVYNGKRRKNGNQDYVKVSSVLKRISQRGIIFTQMGESKTNINI